MRGTAGSLVIWFSSHKNNAVSGESAWSFLCERQFRILRKSTVLPKKLRVMVAWTLDLLFARDIEQMLTLRDVEALSDMAGRIRARRTQQTSITAAPY